MDEVTRDFITFYRQPGTDVRQLALQAGRYPEVDMQEALTQIAGWQTALRKLPSWAATEEILYPPHLSMEQCSSEQTARYKAEVVASVGVPGGESSLADLTGGFGVDFSFLAPKFSRAVYVERQVSLCERARHNFPLLGLPAVGVVQAEAEEYLRTTEPVDWIYLDPARRDGKGTKVVSITDCQPDVKALLGDLQVKSGHILVKFSPMLDLTQVERELPGAVCSVHVVAVGGECKELLLVLRGTASGTQCRELHTVDFRHDGARKFSFSREEEEKAVCEYADVLSAYLYEPNAAVLKAGAYRLLAVRYGLKKLHPNSHLYTSDYRRDDFPGRCFRVQATTGFGKKDLKLFLGDLEKANLTVRGFPSTVADLRKRLALKEGGEAYLFATTLADERKVLIRCAREVS